DDTQTCRPEELRKTLSNPGPVGCCCPDHYQTERQEGLVANVVGDRGDSRCRMQDAGRWSRTREPPPHQESRQEEESGRGHVGEELGSPAEEGGCDGEGGGCEDADAARTDLSSQSPECDQGCQGQDDGDATQSQRRQGEWQHRGRDDGLAQAAVQSPAVV